jgi:inorganic pyrophosphatase
VLEQDLIWGGARDITDLPSVLIERLEHYFLTYKLVPGQAPKAHIDKVYGRKHAFRVVEASMADYVEKFR